MVLPYLTRGRALQLALMTDTCKISSVLNGALTQIATNVPCRIHSQRLFTETPDPTDANTRSNSEWAWTLPYNQDVQIGYWIELLGGNLTTIVGEVLNKDTWKMATRAFASIPKDAVGAITIEVYRPNDAMPDAFDHISPLTVTVHYSRNQPTTTPVRFSPGGISVQKTGILICQNLSAVIRAGDRFQIDGFACVVTYVLPKQPQHLEIGFNMDISGERI